MAADTSISWTHRPGTRPRTWGPTQGCSRKSEGCRNCYAERMAARFAGKGWSKGLINLRTGKWNGVLRLATHKLDEPLRWREPATVFVNSMSDLFHEGLTNLEIAAVFGVMAACPQHTFQILTKRADRMRAWFAWVDGPLHCIQEAVRIDALDERSSGMLIAAGAGDPIAWPLPNVWLGVSVENQAAADERIPELLRTPAAIRFLSCEPLIGPVDLGRSLRRVLWTSDGRELVNTDPGVESEAGTWRRPLDWVIAGCESGPGSRACDVAWLRALRDQCAGAGVPYFLKQAEESTDLREDGLLDIGDDDTIAFGDGSHMKARRPGGHHVIELPYLDGVQHAAFPTEAG